MRRVTHLSPLRPVWRRQRLADEYSLRRPGAIAADTAADHGLVESRRPGRDGHRQAQAEIRRAAAVAVEQEMKARVQEMQAEVVRAQSEVPKAMAEAFRSGRLGVMDYYKMENIQSDTAMRGSIAHPEGKK